MSRDGMQAVSLPALSDLDVDHGDGVAYVESPSSIALGKLIAEAVHGLTWDELRPAQQAALQKAASLVWQFAERRARAEAVRMLKGIRL